MATTFNVIYLGVYADIDFIEGNNIAEGADQLVGLTFGGVGESLVKRFVTFSPGSTGFSAGTAAGYDSDNSPSETFRIDGGPDQTFDSTAVYNATITYIDGTTATITAVLFQDTAGKTYLAPEFEANADQAVLEAKPIRSLTLDSLVSDTFAGLGGNRETWDFAVCFVTGTRLLGPGGPVRVETLKPGDLVLTKDNGPMPVRWAGGETVAATAANAPVRILAGALGAGLPRRDLVVSQQHRLLISSKITERVAGDREVLVAAKKLVGWRPGISIEDDLGRVTYRHVLLDSHQIIFAEGTPTESLLTGPMALSNFSPTAIAQMSAQASVAVERSSVPARQIASGKLLEKLLERHARNGRCLIEPGDAPTS